MLTIAIETTTEQCQVGLVDISTNTVYACRSQTLEPEHGCDTVLAPMTAELVASVPVDTLDAVAVACGPGFFSGLRAGCAFARAMALSLAIDCFGVDTLCGMVASCCNDLLNGQILAVLPARRRNPDRSWWMRTIVDGHLHTAPQEADLATMHNAARNADLIVTDVHTAENLPATTNRIVVVARPGATGVAWAVGRGWAMRPALPVHVRAPQAIAGSWTQPGK